MDEDHNHQETLSIFTNECLAVARASRNQNPEINLPIIFSKVWEKFSNLHQSSPTRVNNNISRCGKPTTPTSCLSRDNQTYTKKLKLKESHLVSIERCTKSKLLRIMSLAVNLLEGIFIFLTCLVLFYVIIVLHKPTQAFVSRNTQDLIYPLMRALRLLSLPVIRQFPSITEIYEESCLISNPNYLSINNYDCWPCENVREVIDLTGFSNFSTNYYHGGIPFIVKDALRYEVDIEKMRKLHSENVGILKSVNFLSNINGIRTLEDVFPINETKIFEKYKNLHIALKINQVKLTRLFRKYFPKPYFIPMKTEVSIQHFLFLDNFNSPTYSLPLTEFANVFLIQATGSRPVVLIPTEKCFKNCKIISVYLQHRNVLFYNWLYWHPKSVPAQSSNLRRDNNISVTYLGSFY